MKALLTGITGQDGSYLAELLLSKGYEVHGLLRRSSTQTTWRIDPILDRLHLHEGDLADGGSLARILTDVEPDEVYNLGAQTHVGTSFASPEYTGDVTGVGAARLLEAIRCAKKRARYYQASTSELYGNAPSPQHELTPMIPRSPYGAAKLYAHAMTRVYREGYGLYASSGILFNHESPRRGAEFVSRKITIGLARIRAGLQESISLGNIDAKRDWGHARDYVDAMWRMLQQDKPDDYVIASGETRSVREFLDEAFGHLDMDWRRHVVIDEKLYRPAEVHLLCGDAGKAREVLGWQPITSFRELVREMVDADLAAVARAA